MPGVFQNTVRMRRRGETVNASETRCKARDRAPRISRKCFSVVTFLVPLFAMTGAAFAQAPKTDIEDVRIGFGVEGVLKPGFWCPIKISIRSLATGFQGQLVVTTSDSDNQEVSFVLPNVAVERAEGGEAAAHKTIYHHVKPGSVSGSVQIRLLDANRRQVDERKVDLLNPNQTTQILRAGQMLVVTIGATAGLTELNRDAIVVDENQKIVQLLSIEDMPTQWFAYGPTDALVISTRDQAFFNKLDPLRASALQSWVRQGGRLIVSAAENWQVVDKSFLGQMLPAKLTGTSRLRAPEALESFAGGRARLDNSGQGLPVANLKDVKGKVVVQQGDRPLIVSGSYGLGSVTLFAFDVDGPPFANWADRKEFWIRHFDFLRSASQDPASQARRQQLAFAGVTDSASRLQHQLENFPEVTVVPFGWVALLIFGYILLIGPIDYFLLKKVIGRLELTWITFPMWVILVSVAAYFGANYLKGSDLRINRVDIVDVDVGSQSLRGSSFMALFSPRIARYTTTMTPKLGNGGSWASLDVGSDQVERTSSWCGVPEDAMRGMYRRGTVGLFGGRSYSYPEGGEPTSVDNVPVQVWSVKAFAYRWLAKAGGTLEADVKVVDESLVGTIVNRFQNPLTNVVVVWSDRTYEVPRLDPGGSIDLGAAKSRTLSGFLGDQRIVSDDDRGDNFAQPQPSAAGNDIEAIVRGLLFSGKTPKSSRRLPSNYLRELDMSDRLDLGKVVVFAKVEGDGGQLWYNATPEDTPGKSSEPPAVPGIVRTNTFVRVFIDPKKENP